MPVSYVLSARDGIASPGEARASHLRNGLIGAWMPVLGQTGTLIRDFSQYNSHGTLANMTLETDLVIGGNSQWPGYALDFDGLTGEVNLGSPSHLDNVWDGGATIVGWLNTRSSYGENGNGGILVQFVGNSTSYAVQTRSSSSGLAFFIAWSGTNGQWTCDLPAAIWHHFAMTYNADATSNSPQFYVNGLAVTTTITTGPPTGTRSDPSAADVLIGNRTDNDNRTFDGLIGSIMLWNRFLSPGEIRQTYQDPYAMWQTRQKVFGKAPAAGGGIAVLRRRREGA